MCEDTNYIRASRTCIPITEYSSIEQISTVESAAIYDPGKLLPKPDYKI